MVARLRPLESSDLLWQIRTGEQVLATHRRVTTDLFSFPFRGAPVHDHEAAFEAFAAWMHAHFGFGGLWWVNLGAVMLLAAVATHLAGTLVEHASSRVVGVACALAASAPRLELRPEHATFAALFLAHLLRRSAAPLDATQGPERTRALLRILAPVPLAAMAALCHGLAPIVGLASIASAIGAVVERRPRRVVLLDVGVAVGCVAAAELVAPGTLRNLTANAGGVSHIVEWYSPLHFIRSSGQLIPLFMLGVAFVAIAGLVRLVRASRARWSDVAFVSLVTVGGLRYVRIAAIVPVVAMPLFIAGIAAVFELALARARLAIRATAATVACVASLYVVSENLEFGLVRGFDFARQPAAAVEWLKANRPNAALFHPYNFGAYLVWERYPPRGVVIDGRAATLYPHDYVEHYYAASNDPALFDAWATAAPFDTVLLQRGHRGTRTLANHLATSPSWKLAHADVGALVFVRVAQ